MGEIHRMSSWTHREAKRPRGVPGLVAVEIKARPGNHAVFLKLGEVAADALLTDEWLRAALAKSGLAPVDGAVIIGEAG